MKIIIKDFTGNVYFDSCRMFVLITIMFFCSFLWKSSGVAIFSQNVGVSINTTGTAADGSAILDASSTNKGMLIPRMTTIQRNAIVSPANSLLIFNTTSQCFEGYNANSSTWVAFSCIGCPAPAQPSAITGTGTVCQSQSGVTFSVTKVTGTTYSWSYSGTGFTINSGYGTNSINADFSASATSGTISVTGSNACGSSTASTLSITLIPSLASPTEDTHTPAMTAISWNWSTVSGATGYQWNTSNTYPGAGINVVASPTYYQSGLTCGTAYTLFVWAYNSCGYSAVTTLSKTTLSCCAVSCSGSGNMGTLAGNGAWGYSGDGGQAVCSQLNMTTGVAVDASGNVFISDCSNRVVRKVTASTGIITTIAGNGSAGYAGDGGAATSAKIGGSFGLALDGSGNVYIDDYYNNVIRKLTVSTGIITTIAGNYALGAGYNGDGIAATAAMLNGPMGVAVDASGNVFISDYLNNRIRKITGGIISTFAGNGTGGYTGDGGAAAAAKIYQARGINTDGAGNVYIADASNNVIRKVTVSTGKISTIAGYFTLFGGYNGDGISATTAELWAPLGVAVDASGNVYIADAMNYRVRKVTLSTGIISTIAGNGTSGFNGDNIAATSANIYTAYGVAVDGSGNVYIADYNSNRIRVVCH